MLDTVLPKPQLFNGDSERISLHVVNQHRVKFKTLSGSQLNGCVGFIKLGTWLLEGLHLRS